MKLNSWLKTVSLGLCLSASTIINPYNSFLNSQEKNLRPIEKHLSAIVNDTTFLNKTTLKGLDKEYALWYEILSRSKDETIIYKRDDFSIIDIRPTLFEESQDEINKRIIDSITNAQSINNMHPWNHDVPLLSHSSSLKYGVPIKKATSQQDIDKQLLEKLHMEYLSKPMPKVKSQRSIGMHFGKHHIITEALERMAPYLEYYIDVLEEKDLPLSLLTIPILESSFNPQAISWAGAVGQFQFMPSTAKDFKLPVSDVWIDNIRAFDYRKHPIVAFDAFVSYMDNLLARSKDYPFLAPVKYNTGPNKSCYNNINSSDDAIKVIKEMGFAPRSYVPEIMAIVTILKEMLDERSLVGFEYNTIRIETMPERIKPSQIEEILMMHPDTFFMLNPHYAKTNKDLYVLREGSPYVTLK